MDPNLEQQNDQSQQKQSGGRISQGINTINNLAGRGLKNPLGKIGSGAALQAARSGFTAFLASPAGLPILITIAAVVLFTIIIVGFGGISSQGDTQLVGNPTLTPTPPVAL